MHGFKHVHGQVRFSSQLALASSCLLRPCRWSIRPSIPWPKRSPKFSKTVWRWFGEFQDLSSFNSVACSSGLLGLPATTCTVESVSEGQRFTAASKLRFPSDVATSPAPRVRCCWCHAPRHSPALCLRAPLVTWNHWSTMWHGPSTGLLTCPSVCH